MPDLGYEYHRIREITVAHWHQIEIAMKEIFRHSGYDKEEQPYGPRQRQWESKHFIKRLKPGELVGIGLLTDKPFVGMELNGIVVHYEYPDDLALAPTIIEIRPQRGGWDVDQMGRAMIVIEQVEQKAVFADAFRVVYKCLPKVSGFVTEGERKQREEQGFAMAFNMLVAPQLFR